jgi:hypothetical protein
MQREVANCVVLDNEIQDGVETKERREERKTCRDTSDMIVTDEDPLESVCSKSRI